MAPDLAAHIIRTYTRPNELVVDPMCGTGTTLVEAVDTGRRGLGIDCEKRWTELARQNLDLAQGRRAGADADVVTADARELPGCLPAALKTTFGAAALILTSPPYGPSSHAYARIRTSGETGQPGLSRRRDTYGAPGNEVNLANACSPRAQMVALSHVLRGAKALLRSCGHLVVTARPWRLDGELVDLPSMIIEAAENAGFRHVERCVALLAGFRDGRLQARPSFLQLAHVRKARSIGQTLHLISHEDVLIFRARAEPDVATCLPTPSLVWSATNTDPRGPLTDSIGPLDDRSRWRLDD